MDREERRWERRIATLAAEAAVRGILDLPDGDAALSAAMHTGELLRIGGAGQTATPVPATTLHRRLLPA